MDFLIWQPLSIWSEKFRYEFAASSPQTEAIAAIAALNRLGPSILRGTRKVTHTITGPIRCFGERLPRFSMAAHPRFTLALRRVRTLVLLGLIGFMVYVVIVGVIALVRTLAQPWPAEVRLIPAATGASIIRLFVAYLLSLAWIIPCTLAASSNPRLRQQLASIAEIVGSVPATALFPLIVMFVIKVTGGMNLASILLILTGMQWYLLFNLLAGVSQIPEDLKEAARSFGLSRIGTWRKLVLPALMPSLITGSITAWGGGWNALILSEYFVYQNHTYEVLGLGALLDSATYRTGNSVMIMLSLLSMVAVVLVLNRLVWRKLYNVATERYRLDY
jgi:NitT/TauT family transport system permease protein